VVEGGFACFCVGLRSFVGGALWDFFRFCVGLRPVTSELLGFFSGPEANASDILEHATNTISLSSLLFFVFT